MKKFMITHINILRFFNPDTGVVYCKEYVYHKSETYLDDKWEVPDFDRCWCNWRDNTMPLDGFCSEGKKTNE